MPGPAYEGRLAFDPDTGFHIDPEGKPVITQDEGKTWFYADPSDQSHLGRYHQREVIVTGTTDASLPGHEHHDMPLETDLHFSAGATNDRGIVTNTRITTLPDRLAPTATSHTGAWS